MIKRVLHLSQTDIRYDSRILKEMNSLRDSGMGLELFGIGAELKNTSHKDSEISDITIYTISLVTRKLPAGLRFLRHTLSVIELSFKMLIRAYKLKPDIIHCHDTPVLPLGALLKILLKTKLIYDAHELESNRNGLPKLSSKLVLNTEKILWKYVDYLIVVSPSIAVWYNENISKKKSEVILNSPTFSESKHEKDDYLRNKYQINNSDRIFIYVGGLMHGRGLEILADTFKGESINSHLVFLGYGELEEQFKALSNKMSNIHVHEAVSHDKVVSITRSADVGLCFIENVSLSDYYCLPNKLFEYSFSEIPILASDFPEIKRIIDEYSLGEYCELNEEAILEKIVKYESLEELPEVKSDVLKDLSWANQAEKLVQVYKEIN